MTGSPVWIDCGSLPNRTQSQLTTFLEKSLHLAESLCITNYNFYAFLCWYNYVLLVSCWISFFSCLLSARSLFLFRMLTLPYLVSIPQFHFVAVQHKGGISYSFTGIDVVSSYMAHRRVTHTSIEQPSEQPNEWFLSSTELFKRLTLYWLQSYSSSCCYRLRFTFFL